MLLLITHEGVVVVVAVVVGIVDKLMSSVPGYPGTKPKRG